MESLNGQLSFASDQEPVQSLQKVISDRQKTKGQICYHYRRCLCHLSKSECNFAHGIDDLNMEEMKVKLDQAVELHKTIKNKQDLERCIKQIERNRIHQDFIGEMDLNTRFYLAQKELKDLGYIDSIYMMEEIELDYKVCKPIKKKVARDMSRRFIEFLFSYFNTIHLDKWLVELCFRQISWKASYVYFVDTVFTFEAREKNKRSASIVKMPPRDILERKVEESIAQIIKNRNLMQEVPISPSKISKYYYIDVSNSIWTEPTMAGFFKVIQKELDAYLAEISGSDRFLDLLSRELNVNREELCKITIFDNTLNENYQISKLMVKIIQNFERESEHGITTLEILENHVFEKLFKVYPNSKSNLSSIRYWLKNLCLKNNAIIVPLLPATFVIFGNKLRKPDAITNKQPAIDHLDLLEEEKAAINIIITGTEIDTTGKVSEVLKEESKEFITVQTPNKSKTIGIQRFERNLRAPIENMDKIKTLPAFDECKLIIPDDRFTEEEVLKFIDSSKIMLIDAENEHLLEEFELDTKKVDSVGVDIEGCLRKNGYIELIQISVGERIYVFDFFSVQSRAVHKNDQNYERLYLRMVKTIQNIMQNELICKIFHDGRKDSLVLRLLLDALPSHNYDVSAAYKLNQQLMIYEQYKEAFRSVPQNTEPLIMNNIQTKECSKIYNQIETVRDPGLNEVLRDYKAAHGINPLKEIMKHRMHSLPRDYFLRRPIDRENLIYASKDVEDLVQIKSNTFEAMVKKFESLFGLVDEEKIYRMFRVISDSYEAGDPDI